MPGPSPAPMVAERRRVDPQVDRVRSHPRPRIASEQESLELLDDTSGSLDQAAQGRAAGHLEHARVGDGAADGDEPGAGAPSVRVPATTCAP